MATAMQIERVTESGPVLVAVPESACGQCRFHVPAATTPTFWCKCRGAQAYEKGVTPGQAACSAFVPWPDGGWARPYAMMIAF